MKISTKGRYGLRALVDLCLHHQSNKPVLLRDVATRQKISRRYLERLFTSLKAVGILRSVRGASGGYILAKDPNEITAYDVLKALEGPITAVDCVENKEKCPMSSRCVTHRLWGDITKDITGRLKNLSLGDLARMQTQIESDQSHMYYI
jgi:Rrf2 family protein